MLKEAKRYETKERIGLWNNVNPNNGKQREI